MRNPCQWSPSNTDRVIQLGVKDFKANSSRLKDKLCEYIPHLEGYQQGRNVLMTFRGDIGQALADACQERVTNAVTLARAAEIVREEMFQNEQAFDGSLPIDCEEKFVPSSLLTLVKMVLEGPSIKYQSLNANGAALSLAQLIKYNSVKRARDSSSVDITPVRHRSCQETPLPIYVGMMVYATTRKMSVVDKLFHLGLCVSYDRVMNMTKDISTAVSKLYEERKVVHRNCNLVCLQQRQMIK